MVSLDSTYFKLELDQADYGEFRKLLAEKERPRAEEAAPPGLIDQLQDVASNSGWIFCGRPESPQSSTLQKIAARCRQNKCIYI